MAEAILTKGGRPISGNQYIIGQQCIEDIQDGKLLDLSDRVKIEITSGDSLRYLLNRKNNKDKGLIIRL